MMIGRVQVTRRGVRGVMLVAAVAACVVYFGVRTLGLSGDAPAAGQGEQPVLTISLPPNCEGGQADPAYGGIWGYDDDGDQVRTGTSGPYYFLNDLGAMELRWQIVGGTAPYEISVQGQTLLTGPAGSTRVYCAARCHTTSWTSQRSAASLNGRGPTRLRR